MYSSLHIISVPAELFSAHVKEVAGSIATTLNWTNVFIVTFTFEAMQASSSFVDTRTDTTKTMSGTVRRVSSWLKFE